MTTRLECRDGNMINNNHVHSTDTHLSIIKQPCTTTLLVAIHSCITLNWLASPTKHLLPVNLHIYGHCYIRIDLLKDFILLNSIFSSSLMSAQTLVIELLLTQCRMFGTTSRLESNPRHYIKPLNVTLKLTQVFPTACNHI